MRTALVLLALVSLAGPAAAKDVEVQLRNEAGGALTITVPEGRSVVIEENKEGAITTSDQTRKLVVTFKGCKHPLEFRDPLDVLRANEDGPVKLMIAADLEFYFVPFELILQTPPNFLESQQPGNMPVYAGKADCPP